MTLTARRYNLDDPFVAEVAAAAASVFAAPGFLSALATTLVGEQGAELILVGVSDETGPVALFPFTSRFAGRLHRIEGLGLGVADYYTPVLAREADPAELWAAVRTALPPADILHLINVPGAMFTRSHGLEHAGFLTPMGHASTVLPLVAEGKPIDPASFSAAKDVRRKLKKLAALGPVSFTLAETPLEKSALFDALVRFRDERFGKLGRADKLSEPGVSAFYRQLLDQGTAQIFGLSVGGEVIAVVYGFVHEGVFTLIIPTMTAEPKFEPGSPGLVSLYMAIEACIQRGDRVFDFSVGSLHYKTRFGAEKRDLFELVEARSLIGVPAAVVTKARSFVRSRRVTKQAA